MNYFHNSSNSAPWLPAAQKQTHRRTPGATWEVGKRMRPGVGCATILFLPSFWRSQVGVMQLAAAGQNSTPCQEEQDRFYDLLLAAVAALSMGPARVALGDRNCPGFAFVWGWHVIGRRTGAQRWNQSKRNHPHFQVSEMFPFTFTQRFLCYVCIFCMPWLNMIKLS